MRFENLKRIDFLYRFISIVLIYFFLRAIAQVFLVKEVPTEQILNYLIVAVINALVLQVVKAEKFQKLNKLSIAEILMFIGFFVLVALEFLF